MSFESLSWLAVVPALGLLILVHELGHFFAAIKMGVKVEEFGIGYPPRMLTLFVRNGVRYTLNWLPLGGFVRMQGEEGSFDQPGSLSAASPWRRIFVLSAGVIMNMITAMVIFGIIFAIWGKQEIVPGRVVINTVDPTSVAAKAGLQPGDRVVSINGTMATSSEQIRGVIQESAEAGQPMTVVIERNSRQQTIENITARPLASSTDNAPRLGVVLAMDSVTKTYNPLTALWAGITHSLYILVQMTVGFGQLIGGLFGVGASPGGGVAGPVGIARIAGAAARTGMRNYLELTALLSVNLALINALPIPALDGSRIVFALVEWVRRGRRVAPEKEAYIHAIGMLVLLGLIVLVTISDISNAIQGEPVLP